MHKTNLYIDILSRGKKDRWCKELLRSHSFSDRLHAARFLDR